MADQDSTLVVRIITFYYLCDTMLAWVLAMVLFLCLCLSVTSWCSIEMAEPVGLVFSMGVSFQLSYSVLCVCYLRLLTIMWPCVLQSTINYWCRCKHYRHVINTAEEGLKRYANDPLLKFIVAFGMMREGSSTYIAMPNVLNCYIK